ncbi:MAG: DUF2508 family protein [Clostridium sp.]|uniref:DUF2508 family protein n=1 Tax=Clostridium sp. TaxID=1506 RepID=UPI002FCC16F4
MDNKLVLETGDLLDRGIKKTKSGEVPNSDTLALLIKEAREAMRDLRSLRAYYEFVTDKELIEYAIYREKAEQERISYLIRRIKEIAE